MTNTTEDDDELVLIDCPLCADPSHTPQDPLSRFVAGDETTLTCQSAFDLGPLQLPEANCTFWQSRGDLVCQCAEEAPAPNECTLCESGTLPEPLKEGLPGKVCSAVQVDAVRDEPELCLVYQQTVGVYCGCDNPLATAEDQDVCRLCGGSVELSVPLFPIVIVDEEGVNIQTTCVELEFLANLPGAAADCQEFQQQYGESGCCPDPPTQSPTDGAMTQQVLHTILLAMVAGALSFLVV